MVPAAKSTTYYSSVYRVTIWCLRLIKIVIKPRLKHSPIITIILAYFLAITMLFVPMELPTTAAADYEIP
jgi:hypothetical protein